MWRCEVIVGGPDIHRRGAILWTHTGTAVVAASTRRDVHRLDGSTTTVTPGAPVEVSEAPSIVLDRA